MGGRRNQPGSVADLSTAQRMVLDEVTGERTTRQIAMAAGLLSFAARERLEELEHLGLVQRVGLWWGRA